MSKLVTIRVSVTTRAQLARLKSPPDTYDDVIRDLLISREGETTTSSTEEEEG